MQFVNLNILYICKSIIRGTSKMALLLAMYQKMRLIREINQESVNLTRFSSKVDRIAKNIKNVQKMYEGRMKTLESQAKMMQSQASLFFQNQFNLGNGSVNPYDYSGMNGYIYSFMRNAFQNDITEQYDNNGNQTRPNVQLGDDLFCRMYEVYMSNNGQFPAELDENGQPTRVDGVIQYQNGFSADQVSAFNMAMQNARMAQSQAQMQCQQVSTQYQNNVSIWLEAQKAQLEAEQDEALEPLSYEQTMMELDKEASEERLTRLKAELQSYKELCKQEAQDAAPKFGLG